MSFSVARRRVLCPAHGVLAPGRHASRASRVVRTHAQAETTSTGRQSVSQPKHSHLVQGGRLGTEGSGRSLVPSHMLPLPGDKQVVLVRHGVSDWNLEGRIQGSSDKPVLSDVGAEQAAETREALNNFPFKACFSSPVTRAAESARIMWPEEAHEPGNDIIFLDELQEAHLGWLQGMTNRVAAKEYSDVYRSWRTEPETFEINGRRPIPDVFERALDAWQAIILHPSDVTLVVSHKSVLRAMICTAMGLGPAAFRALDVHNSGVTTIWVNTNGEAMLQSLNLTTHLAVPLKY